LAVSSKKGSIAAKIELDVATASGVKRQEVTVCDGDLVEQTARRAIYADFRIGEINTAKGAEFLELRYPGGEVNLALGQAHGDVDALAVQREMIRRTIREHLEKEIRLRPLGIKVLSLFFIDAVERYRQYDADGNAVKGDYASIFEEEYRRAAKLPTYQSLFAEVDLASAAEQVHNGYFSIDKKGGWSNTAESNAGNRENAERAYNLIMKEKEKLLGFETPLKFIFSHSALKEGWDNPNVFQICALREMGSERERRQTIGRGLRLCVNQAGERVAAVQALVVVQHPVINQLTQLGAGHAARGTTDQGAKDGASQRAQCNAGWTAGDTNHAAKLGAVDSTSSAAGGSANGADETASFLGHVSCGDPGGLAMGTFNSHGNSSF
jgi:type III restriction enzyme